MKPIQPRGAIKGEVKDKRVEASIREIDSHPLFVQLQEKLNIATEKLKATELREIDLKTDISNLRKVMETVLKTPTILYFQKIVHDCSKAHGWWEGVVLTPDVLLSKLALIHSEVSEALEDVREGRMETVLRDDGKPEGFPSELADVLIRCMDLAESLGIDLHKEIEQKHAFNLTRPYMHGGKKL